MKIPWAWEKPGRELGEAGLMARRRELPVTLKAVMQDECGDKERPKGPQSEPALEKPPLERPGGEEERDGQVFTIFCFQGDTWVNS